MYSNINFKSKAEFKRAVAEGKRVTLFAPGLGQPVENGDEYVEGPHFPQPHKWYAKVLMKNGVVVKVS